jgi:hypothetical protein
MSPGIAHNRPPGICAPPEAHRRRGALPAMSPRTKARMGNSAAIAALMARERVCVVPT